MFVVCLVGFDCVAVKLLHVGVGMNDCLWECGLELSLPLFYARVDNFVGFLVGCIVYS